MLELMQAGSVVSSFVSSFASPLVWPLARTLGGVLLAGLLLLLVLERRHLRELHRRVLFQRWAVWAVIAPVYSLAVLGGPLTLGLLVALLVFQGLREYSRLVSLPPLYRTVLLVLGLAALPLALLSPTALFETLPLLLVVGTLQPLVTQDVRAGVRTFALAAFGYAYLPLLLVHLLLVERWLPGGAGILLVLGLATALSDVGAFTVGKLCGRHSLSPILSPNKTWEGVLGNALGAAVGTALLADVLPASLPFGIVAALPVVVAVGAVWGDLLESLIKREFGVKDAGAWLPGFGGLLDRADSLIVTAPLVYHLLRTLG
ncbi:MAG: phosphatidate cytidylyltransferase [Chloroflexi bacterium]|nr:phosphatidate cytidylyltransferase [Chloroflexota bacterium]